jgi:hypothetical protein
VTGAASGIGVGDCPSYQRGCYGRSSWHQQIGKAAADTAGKKGSSLSGRSYLHNGGLEEYLIKDVQEWLMERCWI